MEWISKAGEAFIPRVSEHTESCMQLTSGGREGPDGRRKRTWSGGLASLQQAIGRRVEKLSG